MNIRKVVILTLYAFFFGASLFCVLATPFVTETFWDGIKHIALCAVVTLFNWQMLKREWMDRDDAE